MNLAPNVEQSAMNLMETSPMINKYSASKGKIMVLKPS